MVRKMSIKCSNWIVAVAAALIGVCVSVSSSAAEWGSIKGRILIDGMPKKPAPLVVAKDQFCINARPENDALVIGKENALVNAVVYLRVGTGAPKVAINPGYDAAFNKAVVLDNKNCMFHPHITVVRKDQMLDILNSDPVGHNTNIALIAFNQLIPAMGKIPVKVTATAVVPMPVQCNIHPWMKGYVLSLDHPYAAVTGDEGKFEIKDMPVGEHEFQFWHDSGYLENVKFKGGVTDKRGRAKIKIAPGEPLDLGDIKVPAAGLN
jgi:hypothetical protein